MALAELFARLRGRKEKAATDAATGYQQLVAALADGKKTPPAEQVEAILDAAGKTPDELETAVEQLQETRRLRPLVEQLPALREAMKQAGAALEQHKLDVAKRARDDALRQKYLNEQYRLAHRRLDAALQAGQQLREIDDNARAKYAAAKGGEVVAATRRQRLRDELRQLREARIPTAEKAIAQIREARRRNEHVPDDALADAETRLAALRERAEALPCEIATVEAEYIKQHARRRELQYV